MAKLTSYSKVSSAGKNRLIVTNKAWTYDCQVWTVDKVASSEYRVYVDFGRRVPYQVVKLSTRELPPKDTDGKRITWCNNFGVKGPSGKYAQRVKYTLFIPEYRDKTFVYYQHGALRHDKKPTKHGTRPARHGMLQVDFYTGDPGAGLK